MCETKSHQQRPLKGSFNSGSIEMVAEKTLDNFLQLLSKGAMHALLDSLVNDGGSRIDSCCLASLCGLRHIAHSNEVTPFGLSSVIHETQIQPARKVKKLPKRSDIEGKRAL